MSGIETMGSKRLSEFGGAPMVVGEMYGLRGWYVDHHGRLTGLGYRAVWRPGENVAECMVKRFRVDHHAKWYYKPAPPPIDPWGPIIIGGGALAIDAAVYVPAPAKGSGKKAKRGKKSKPAAPAKPAPMKYTCNPAEPWSYPGFTWNLEKAPKVHTEAPKDDCSCGFYAYHSVTGEVYGTVVGIIKAYGNTVVGTKGLRCEKAQIVALLDPGAYTDLEGGEGLLQSSVHTRKLLERNYPDVPILSSVDELLSFAPLGEGLEKLEPSQEEFWTQP